MIRAASSLCASFLMALATAAAAGEVALPVPSGVLPPVDPGRQSAHEPRRSSSAQKLYFDARLSKDDSVACATCHDPRHGFAEPRPVSLGRRRRQGRAQRADGAERRLPAATQFWDGRARHARGAGQGADREPGRDGAWPTHAAVEAKLAGDRRVPAALRERPSATQGDDRPHRPGDRELRAHAARRSRRRSTASWPATRRRDLGRGREARLGAVQRQGALQQLPRPRGAPSRSSPTSSSTTSASPPRT